MNIKWLLPSPIGLILIAAIFSNATWNMDNIWIPITAILFVLAIMTFVIHKTFISMEERIKNLEKQNNN